MDVKANIERRYDAMQDFLVENRNLKLAANALVWEIIKRDSDLSESEAFKNLNKLIDGK